MTALPDDLRNIVLGPEDRLLLLTEGCLNPAELDAVSTALRAVFGERVLLASGCIRAVALRATRAEGSPVGQCGARVPPLFERYLAGESVLSCHLAYGHTGMHSDGSATWSNERSGG